MCHNWDPRQPIKKEQTNTEKKCPAHNTYLVSYTRNSCLWISGSSGDLWYPNISSICPFLSIIPLWAPLSHQQPPGRSPASAIPGFPLPHPRQPSKNKTSSFPCLTVLWWVSLCTFPSSLPYVHTSVAPSLLLPGFRVPSCLGAFVLIP